MFERLVFGFATWLVWLAYLAFRRHFQWQNIIWAGGGFGLALLVLAFAFEGPEQDPLLFMLGATLGGAMQYGFDAETRRRRSPINGERVVT